MPQKPLAWSAFWLWILVVGASPTNVTLTSSDGRVKYGGPWTDEQVYQFAATIGSSVTVTFQGSAVYYVGTITPGVGGVASIKVDGTTVASIDVSTGVGSNTNPDSNDLNPQVLHAQRGLDGSVNHTWELVDSGVGASGRDYLTFNSVIFTVDGASTPPTSDSSSLASGTTVTTGGKATSLASGATVTTIDSVRTTVTSTEVDQPSGGITIATHSSFTGQSDAATSTGVAVGAGAPSATSTSSSLAASKHSGLSKEDTAIVVAVVVAVCGTLLCVFAIRAIVRYRRKKPRTESVSPYLSPTSPSPASPFEATSLATSPVSATWKSRIHAPMGSRSPAVEQSADSQASFAGQRRSDAYGARAEEHRRDLMTSEGTQDDYDAPPSYAR